MYKCCIVLLSLWLASCGQLGREGDPCGINWDCASPLVCHPTCGDPLGDGACIEPLQTGQTCCRPGYALHDCDEAQGLFCSESGVCEADAGGGCIPSCYSREICVAWTSHGNAYNNTYSSGSQCATGCCARLSDGRGACAPSSSYCDGGGCPPGTAPQYAGGPCVAPPSTCPNGWAVCGCPEEHGAWCHPGCDEYLRGEGGPGTYCGGESC